MGDISQFMTQTDDSADNLNPESPPSGPWYTEMTRYHWFVLIVAALGWLFDCLDQQLFILARQPAMRELLSVGSGHENLQTLINQGWTEAEGIVYPSSAVINEYSGYATSIFLLGWATGGLVFGVLGDRIGRAKTMIITILLYSMFTGLSALSKGWLDFAAYRFLTGLGVGGEFAVGVALVAEVMPARARAYCLGLLQALSAVGNISAALIGMAMGQLAERGLVDSVWRPMFVIGAIPALLALVIRRRLKEPERWQQAAHTSGVAQQLGSYRALLGHPTWRKHALLGLVMAFSGVVGLWAVGFFTMDLVGDVMRTKFEGEGLSEAEVTGNVTYWKGMTSLMINVGAALGMISFSVLAQRMGRKPSFAVAFLAAFISTAAVFAYLREFHQIFWMVPIMGVCQLSLFAGYAIYFPELFPTYLRSTGTSFCYNVGRFIAAAGPTGLALLTSKVYADTDEPLRWAGLTMCSIFLVGLFALPFMPETKGRPLPE
jgi:MFS family permease